MLSILKTLVSLPPSLAAVKSTTIASFSAFILKKSSPLLPLVFCHTICGSYALAVITVVSLSSTSKPLPKFNWPLLTVILTFEVKVSESDHIANLLAAPEPSIVPPPVLTDPSAIKNCDDVPPDLTNDPAVTDPPTTTVFSKFHLLLFTSTLPKSLFLDPVTEEFQNPSNSKSEPEFHLNETPYTPCSPIITLDWEFVVPPAKLKILSSPTRFKLPCTCVSSCKSIKVLATNLRVFPSALIDPPDQLTALLSAIDIIPGIVKELLVLPRSR